ncbi:MAG: alkaline phosphatase D family protein [Chitinophagales bacterium]|nr:alkaline phosphatase D family protein [Chitinophagales bacterium]
MYKALSSFACALLLYSSYSQVHSFGTRSGLNPDMYPFYHGVASGDPQANSVIIWSRITLDSLITSASVGWEIFADVNLSQAVQNGVAGTDSSVDYTIKVDVQNLQPNTWYYYRFTYDTFHSVIGRTRTLPVGNVSNIRFAVASCQDYQSGFYNAHRHLAQRNDIDAVLFLGDYTYEDAADNNPVGERYHVPNKKTTTAMDYRIRQSLYHLDPDLQAAHQQYPWICVWDDHETANNSYTDSAKNHNVNDGLWANRKANAIKAYNEWMPVRQPDSTDPYRIFRKFTWGNLADLHMIDTRLYDRSRQAGTTVSITDATLNDSARTMVGPVQFGWLENNLKNSTAKWQILGQQVMMAPLVIPAGVLGATPFIVNGDQWDGYPYERQHFYDIVKIDSIKNVVVLTGDIHTAWANDLPLPAYDTSNRTASVGVEFVAPSITSGNELPPLITAPVISTLAPHVRYVELVRHGYYMLDIKPQKTQADFVYVSDIATQQFTVSEINHYCVNDGETWLNACNQSALPSDTYPPLAPMPLVAGIYELSTKNITVVQILPNPFVDEFQVMVDIQQLDIITTIITDANGRDIFRHQTGQINTGTNVIQLTTPNLVAGVYTLHILGKYGATKQRIVCVNR